jgi:hypothetical protein
MASFPMSVLAAQAFLVFVPALLVLVSAGAWLASPRPGVRAGVLAGLAMLFAAGLHYAAQKPSSPRDYKTLAIKIAERMEPADVILLRHRHWQDTPLFYYLPDAEYGVADFGAALAARPERRAWLVTWPTEETPVVHDVRRDALARYQGIETVTALRAAAELFVLRDGP